MPWSRRNGIAIWYEVAGEGPPLVLLHANPFDHTMWLYQVARLSPRFRTIAVDLRGYGRSDKVATPFSFRDMAEDVVGVMDDLGIARAALMGVSIGATLALQMALDHPKRAARLVLAGGESADRPIFAELARQYASRPIAVQRRAHMELILSPAFRDSAIGRYLIETFLADTPALSGLAIAEIFRARAAVNLQSRLGRLAVPTLVVNGETDVSREAGLATARLIPGAQHRIIPDCGHMSCFENPSGFQAVVEPFLAVDASDGAVVVG